MNIIRKFSSPIAAALVVFAVGMFATFLTYSASVSTSQFQSARDSQQINSQVISELRTRISAISEVLITATPTMQNEDYSTTQLDQLINNLSLNERYPSARTLGFVAHVKKSNADGFLQTIRNTTGESPTLFQDADIPYHLPIIYSKSLSPTPSANLVGVDISSNESFVKLFHQAENSGELSISEPFNITSSDGKVTRSGVAFVQPVYMNSVEIGRDIAGYLFLIFDIEEAFSTIEKSINGTTQVALFDSQSKEPDDMIHGEFRESDEILDEQTISFSNRQWTSVAYANNTVRPQEKTYWLLALGTLLSLISSIFLFFIFRSKSREYELQKELDVQSAKNDLISLASHQLRTPATTVKQYISMVLDGYVGDITQEQREMLGKAFRSNERQLAIVNQILNLSHLEAKKFKPVFESIDLSALIDETVKDCLTNSPDAKVELKNLPSAYAEVDAELMRMVIDNLLSNAIKYSDNLPVEISVIDDVNKVKIQFEDKGFGIEQKDIEKVFELFHRIENEKTLKISGTGIGLYLSKLIVDLHNGNIEVESEPGKGSIFTVTIPKKVSGDKQ